MNHTLNIGVLAHVDAGKTSLTERLLFESGAISTLGSVDSGNTQTDTLAMEQQRGITIRAAVAPFTWNNRQINLIDTPGHPDFIAEVERSLSVLDAVVLVISSDEGVQPQTRRLARAIRTIGLPCIIFCNKIDRTGAREQSLVREIESKLDWPVLPMMRVKDIGTKQANVELREIHTDERAIARLAEHDESLLERWVDDECSRETVNDSLLRSTRSGEIVPITFGSATTGAGVHYLLDMLDWLASEQDHSDGSVSAQAFKIDHQDDRVVLLRIWSGTLRSREEYAIQGNTPEPVPGGKITRLERRTPHGIEVVQEAHAGDIVRAHGLANVRIGDVIGAAPPHQNRRFFEPVFETEVHEVNEAQRHDLRMALADLADQDPFISLRLDPRSGATSIRFFGDVQREVIEAELRDNYGIAVSFAESRVICIERPIGSGESTGHIFENHPFAAGVGLRVTPGTPGSGVHYHRSKASLGKTRHAFYLAIEEAAIATLAEGLAGWEVLDIDVELIFVEFIDAMSTAGDFRALTPLVLMDALRQAGTEVCEPLQQFRLDVPEPTLADAIRHLVQRRAVISESGITGDVAVIRGEIPAAEVPEFERYLPGITRGEGDFDHWHHGWQRVQGDPPVRSRTDFNPLDRVEYLSRHSGRL